MGFFAGGNFETDCHFLRVHSSKNAVLCGSGSQGTHGDTRRGNGRARGRPVRPAPAPLPRGGGLRAAPLRPPLSVAVPHAGRPGRLDPDPGRGRGGRGPRGHRRPGQAPRAPAHAHPPPCGSEAGALPRESAGRFSSGYLGTTESQRDGRADRQTEMVVGTGIMGSYVYHISVYGQQDKEDETEATPTFPIIFRTQPCGGPAWRRLPVRRRSRSCDAARRGTRSAGRARRRRRRSRKAPRRAGRRWCRSCRPGLPSLIGHVGKSCLFGKFAFAPSLVSIAKK